MKSKSEITTVFRIVFSVALFVQSNNAFCGENNSIKQDTPSEISNARLAQNKIVVVRIYPDWRVGEADYHSGNIPFRYEENYKTVRVPLKGRILFIEETEIPYVEPGNIAVVMINPEDQNNINIKKTLNDTIYIYPYAKGQGFNIFNQSIETEKVLTVSDALGGKIADSRVDIYLSDQNNVTKVLVKSDVTDSNGQMMVPKIRMIYIVSYINLIITASEYGSFLVKLEKPEKFNIVLPSIKPQSELFERSVWGTVTTQDGQPVAGALVQCESVVSSTDAKIPLNWVSFFNMPITDEQGRFTIYIPLPQDGPLKLIPPLSKFQIKIVPPENSNLLPFTGRLPNGQESQIVLQSRGAFRKFVFEDSNGLINDKGILQNIRVHIQSKDREKFIPVLGYNDWQNGQFLPPGIYSATTSSVSNLEFESVEVSDETLVMFKVKYSANKNATYTGKIVDAITGQPLQDVYIILQSSVASFTPEGLEKQKMTADIVKQLFPLDKVVQKTDQIFFPFLKMVTTNEEGLFQLVVEPNLVIPNFIIFKQNYMPLDCVLDKPPFKTLREGRVEKDGLIELSPIPLIPCAYVTFEPFFERKEGINTSVATSISYVNQPKWFEESRGKYNSAGVTFFANTHNENFELIPAGVSVRMGLRLQHYGKRSPSFGYPLITNVLNCAQGQTINLGKIVFPVEIPFYVKVTDPRGNKLEGIEVCLDSGDRLTTSIQTNITDSNGIAKMLVPINTNVWFFISSRGPQKIKPSLSCNIRGLEDANSIITFQLTDEVLKDLFRPNEE